MTDMGVDLTLSSLNWGRRAGPIKAAEFGITGVYFSSSHDSDLEDH